MGTAELYEMFEAATVRVGKERLTEAQRNGAIISVICAELRVTASEMFSWGRKRENVQARQVYMKILRDSGRYTLEEIGRKAKCYGREPFDHATALYSARAVQNLADTNRVFANKLLNIQNAVKLIGK